VVHESFSLKIALRAVASQSHPTDRHAATHLLLGGLEVGADAALLVELLLLRIKFGLERLELLVQLLAAGLRLRKLFNKVTRDSLPSHREIGVVDAVF